MFKRKSERELSGDASPVCRMIAQVGVWLDVGVAWGFLSSVSCCLDWDTVKSSE